MKIILIILVIIAIISIIWFFSIVGMNIVTYIVFKYSDDAKYIAVQRDTMLYTNVDNKFYIIPSSSIYNDFGSKRYTTIEISWLKYVLFISYHFKTEVDEEAEAEARRILNKK